MNVIFLVGMARYLSQNTLFKMYMYVPHSCCFKNFVCFHFIKKISFGGMVSNQNDVGWKRVAKLAE